MKYIRLNNSELESLRVDFIKFLAANTITAADWVAIKKNDPMQAEQLIEHFSDLITERVLEETTYLELIGKQQAQVIFCAQKEMILLGAYGLPGSQVDFTAFSDVKDLLEFVIKSDQVKILKGKRKFHADRNLEIFQEIQGGFKIVKESALFQGLKFILK